VNSTWAVPVASKNMCQTLCWGDLGCQKFTYWPDGSCQFMDAKATLKKSTGQNMSSEVVAGSQSCEPTWYDMYPDLASVGGVPTPAGVPPSPGPFLADNSKQKTTGSGGIPWGWVILALAILGIVVGVALYGAGFCDAEKKKKKDKKKGKTNSRSKLTGAVEEGRPETKPLVQEEKPLPTSAGAVPTYQPVAQVVTGSPVASAAAAQASGQYVVSGGQVQVGTPVMSYPQQVMQVQQPVQVVQQVQAGTLFDMMDRNRDGVVSRDEFRAATGR